MTLKIRAGMLGIYDLIMALGAIWIGAEMIRANDGIFAEYPKEWLSKLPFDSWFVPGILAITVFGVGNLIATICSLRKGHSAWKASAIMGMILFASLILQIIILGQAYLATNEFLLFSLIQLALSGFVYLGYRKRF